MKKFAIIIAASLALTACNPYKDDSVNRMYINSNYWIETYPDHGKTIYQECVNDMVPGKEAKALCRLIDKTRFEDMQFQHINHSIEMSKAIDVKNNRAITALEQLPDKKASE